MTARLTPAEAGARRASGGPAGVRRPGGRQAGAGSADSTSRTANSR